MAGIEIVSHRGAQDFAPENTLAAAKLSLDQGCQWISVDVRETADGELVAIHDATLERTTSGQGLVADHTLAQLLEPNAGSFYSAHYAGEKIPTLAEMIRLCQSYGRQMLIENKDADPESILAIVDAMGFADHCVHSSPDAALRAQLRSLSPDVRTMSRRIDYSSLTALKADLEPEIVEIEFDTYAADHQEALALGLTPMLKYFGSDPAVFDQIVDFGPAMVNLDHASLLLDALRRKTKDPAVNE
ncbi:glycerophosphodiester phosphodiesterase [Devosia riboflavina]